MNGEFPAQPDPVHTARPKTAPADRQATTPAERGPTAPANRKATAPTDQDAPTPANRKATTPAERGPTAPANRDATAPTDQDAPTPANRKATAPAGRDRGIDVLRAVAITGVVLGHWLVTAIVLTPAGSLATRSPLRSMGWLAPVTWLPQTLGLFFFVAGYAACRQRSRRPAPGGSSRTTGGVWFLRRVARLAWPIVGFLAAWALALAGGALAGASGDTLHTLGKLAISPLWFIVVLVALGAVTGPLCRAASRRSGVAIVTGVAVLVVAAADATAGSLPATVSTWGAPVTVFAGWLVPYMLGAGLAAGRLPGRRTALSLLVGGGLGVLLLVLAAGYPSSAVGVPGVGRSNLNPPTLATVSLALAQAGAAMLLRERLAGIRWPVVDRVNAAAMRIYLWHQSALILVTVLALRLAGGPVPGLHDRPATLGWVAARLCWLPVFGAVLWCACRPRRRGTSFGIRRPGVP